ncbi:MAG: hypothetical protein ACYTF6_00770 [Planctomycetota bacterium]|jgi:hypothetical protein
MRMTFAGFLVVIVVAGTSGCRPTAEKAQDAGKAASKEPMDQATSELDRLKKNARSENAVVREKAVGKLLAHVKEGMSLEEVEELLGRPADLYSVDGGKLYYATYYARLPDPNEPEGTQLMTVDLKKKGDRLTVVKVSGPHFPD